VPSLVNFIMQIGIKPDAKVMDIQKEFNAFFPYLKLEFYKNLPQLNKPSPKAEKINPEESLKKINRMLEEGTINIDRKKTVSELVLDFWKNYSLSVLVFRKSGNLWIETSLTDSWTLAKQNSIGESFSTRAENL
jgi:hypothetical protein